MKKITLSGNAGTGKTTIAKTISEQLKFEFISIGNFTREYAKAKFNMNINDFQLKCLQEPELDNIIDIRFSDLCNQKDGIVADYRLGFYFIKGAFNVLLKVSDDVAFNRINYANRTDELTDKESIGKRNHDMKQRFIDKYDIDYTDEKNYSLIINTDNYSPTEVSKLIITKFHQYENAYSDRSRLI
ncbi:MAG: cytidylate kinase family protein [Bacteroidales bacterium]